MTRCRRLAKHQEWQRDQEATGQKPTPPDVPPPAEEHDKLVTLNRITIGL